MNSGPGGRHIIKGANIGKTTVTSWIVSMSEWGEMLKLFFVILRGPGVRSSTLFCKNSRKKQVGEILVGFGVLFIGLTFMSASITPYRNAPDFCAGICGSGTKSVSWHSGWWQ